MPLAQAIEKRKARVTNRARAREMRHNPVAMEKLFWSKLRNRQLGGFKFRRQYLVGPYIADFVCTERKLIVELDGPLHADRIEYDRKRDAFLREQGYRVMRFKNCELSKAEYDLERPASPLTPALSPNGGEGETLESLLAKVCVSLKVSPFASDRSAEQ